MPAKDVIEIDDTTWPSASESEAEPILRQRLGISPPNRPAGSAARTATAPRSSSGARDAAKVGASPSASSSARREGRKGSDGAKASPASQQRGSGRVSAAGLDKDKGAGQGTSGLGREQQIIDLSLDSDEDDNHPPPPRRHSSGARQSKSRSSDHRPKAMSQSASTSPVKRDPPAALHQPPKAGPSRPTAASPKAAAPSTYAEGSWENPAPMRMPTTKRRSPPSPHAPAGGSSQTPRPAQRQRVGPKPAASLSESEEEEEQVEDPIQLHAPAAAPTRPTWATRTPSPVRQAQQRAAAIALAPAPATGAPIDAAYDPSSRPASSRGTASTDPLDVISRPMSATPSEGDEAMDHGDDPLAILDDEEEELFPAPTADANATGGMDVDRETTPPARATNLEDATPKQVQQAISDATHGVDDIHITPADRAAANSGPAPSRPTFGETIEIVPMVIKPPRPVRKQTPPAARTISPEVEATEAPKERVKYRKQDRLVRRTREKWRQLVEDLGTRQPRLPEIKGPRKVDSAVKTIDGLTVAASYTIGSAREPIELSPEPKALPAPEETPVEFRAPVRRNFETKTIDAYNRLLPTLTANPHLHREMFQNWMSMATANDEPEADEIQVHNDADDDGEAPDMEFEYSNEVLYNHDVPDPEIGTGCGCDGPCDPKSRSCTCLKRQKLYYYGVKTEGFAYDESGICGETSIPIWECGPSCGCPPECINRVVQRGRAASTKIDLFKTVDKGWGVRARVAIPKGTYLGMYSGELITDDECERRGHLYNDIGRTYLFDLDGYQINHPPPIAKLRKVDPRLAYLAEKTLEKLRASGEDNEDEKCNLYSVDAFHFGFTRYFNHSCDPNLQITQAYVGDYHPERPKLVIFTHRDIAAGEEMCISYMGMPDDETQEIIPTPIKSDGTKSRPRGSQNKTSAMAHVSRNAKPADEEKKGCRCGAWNCRGMMFNIEIG